ncbi:MAG: hypothetical protein ACYTBJ_17265 [Planctomycetota bacterium]
MERWLRDLAEHMAHGNDGARDEAQEAILMADKLAGSAGQNACQHLAECGRGQLYEQIREALGCTKNDSTLQMIHQLKQDASATSEPHPDAAAIANELDVWADRQRQLEYPKAKTLRDIAARVRRFQPVPAKVPGKVWAKEGPVFATRQAALDYYNDPNDGGDCRYLVDYYEECEVHGATEGECEKCKELEDIIKVAETDCWDCCIGPDGLKAERDQALADLKAERETKEKAECNEEDAMRCRRIKEIEAHLKADLVAERARAEKAERIIEEDNERLLLAQREINGLRERVAELEKREEEAEDY